MELQAVGHQCLAAPFPPRLHAPGHCLFQAAASAQHGIPANTPCAHASGARPRVHPAHLLTGAPLLWRHGRCTHPPPPSQTPPRPLVRWQ